MADRSFQLVDLGADQEAVPEALQAVIHEALFAIEKAELKNHAKHEVGRHADLIGNPVVESLLDPALDRRLARAFFGQIDVAGKKRPALIDDVDRLARCVSVVLVGEEGQIVEVVIAKASVEGDGAASPDDHVLVHPAVLDAAVTAAPDPEQHERVAAAVPYPAPEKDVLALQADADDPGGKVWQFGPYPRGKVRFDHLVGIEAHDPGSGDRRVVERPLELPRVVDE